MIEPHSLVTFKVDGLRFGIDVARVQEVLRAKGYDAALLQKLCYDNWLALLDRSW